MGDPEFPYETHPTRPLTGGEAGSGFTVLVQRLVGWLVGISPGWQEFPGR